MKNNILFQIIIFGICLITANIVKADNSPYIPDQNGRVVFHTYFNPLNQDNMLIICVNGLLYRGTNIKGSGDNLAPLLDQNGLHKHCDLTSCMYKLVNENHEF